MAHDFQPSRQKSDLADVIEMLLDKGVVINADIAVSIGDTQLLGIQIRAAIASFETAAKYGLEFPEGTDMRRVAEAAGDPELAEQQRPRPPIDPTRGVNVTAEEGDYGRKDDGGGEGDEESETDSGEGNDAETSEESAIVSSPDRGTERLGARPDPDVPTSGDVDVFDGGPLDTSDDEDGREGEADEAERDSDDGQTDADSETETETESETETETDTEDSNDNN